MNVSDESGLLNDRINVRGYFERVLLERDKADAEREKRLNERFDAQEKAVSAALAAAEKAVTAALLAAEKAVTKAEISQQRVNETQNEFRGTLKDQAADLMPRAETELLVKELNSKVDELRGTRRQGIGTTAEAGMKLFIGLVMLASFALNFYLATRHP